MTDQLARPDLPLHQTQDVFSVWLRRDLQQQFGGIEVVPNEMLALIDRAAILD